MLAEDPADDAFLQVGEELVRRGRWAEAQSVLAGGLAHEPDARGFALLARAALENDDLPLAASALERVERDPSVHVENARTWILVLERSGQLDDARAAAMAFLRIDPHDVVVQAVVERLDAPPPDGELHALDPFYTVERAERYVRVGRIDRAIRAYRRILMRHPMTPALELRLRQLASESIHADDDLSEELTDPGLLPPEPLSMPSPRLNTATGAPPRSARGPSSPGLGDEVDDIDTEVPAEPRAVLPVYDDEDVEEDTDLDNTPLRDAARAMQPRRRRRSLIRR